MPDIVLHALTSFWLQRLRSRPAHGVMIVGPPGSGKMSLARTVACSLLNVAPEALDNYPYLTVIQPVDNKAISIESIRSLQHFITLKIPAKAAISRIVVIEDAHLMTVEAQNALLKTLEEPPVDTVLILTAATAELLLPTIQSRVRLVHAAPPSTTVLKEHFMKDSSYEPAEIDKALMLSGGLPGLTHALLTDQANHPLYKATAQARALLQATTYERLVLVESLSKQKQGCLDMVFILGGMARMALGRSDTLPAKAVQRWSMILQAAYRAESQLRTNAQTKLVLINLMLEL